MKNIPSGLFSNQPKINFEELSHIENKISNQEHFEANKDKFSHQCRVVYEALLRGEKLTTSTALIIYRIGDLRRRIKDLKDIWNVPIQDQYVEGKFKEYFLINNNQ